MTKQVKTAKVKVGMKSCFVICPIGVDGSEIRARSDDVFNHLISPITTKHGYEAFRITDVPTPGEITPQIVEAVMESDLVIADLTGKNPNVFYELALRHMIGEPFIHLVTETSEIPFDIAGINAIKLRFGSAGGLHQTERELDEQLATIVTAQANFQNPVSRYRERSRLEASGDADKIAVAELLDEVAQLRGQVSRLERKSSAALERTRGLQSPGNIRFYQQELPTQEELILAREFAPSEEKLSEARSMLRQLANTLQSERVLEAHNKLHTDRSKKIPPERPVPKKE